MGIATDVISLQDVKDWLIQPDSADNTPITRLIKSAVSWVEKYTCYRMFPRDEIFVTWSCKTELPYFPINSKSIKLQDGTDYVTNERTYFYAPLQLVVNCPIQSAITLNTGFTNPDDVPGPLIEAVYKLVTYLYENRDAYSTVLPLDIQILVNEYRRSPTI